MIDRLPNIQNFTRLYWNTARDDRHLEPDFRLMMEDARRFSDRGQRFYQEIERELSLIDGSEEYVRWVDTAFDDPRLIRECGHFVMPDDVPTLLNILREYRGNREA